VALFSTAPAAQAAEALLPRYYTEGRAVMQAFESLNSQARAWTVRVVCDSQTVAVGTIIREDGWILTKASDLRGSITCQFEDDQELPAEFVAYDQETDLALLKVEATGLPVLQWSDDPAPSIGRWVVTVGMGRNPAGVGIVSAAHMEVPAEQGAGVLGIELVQSDGVPEVRAVVPESGAERAKLATGDIVQRVDDLDVNSRLELVEYISSHRPGDLVSLVIRRGEETLTIPVRLAYPSGRHLTSQGMMDHMGGELSFRRSGFSEVIPHDTVIAPNACGGPLVDLSGRAVGINIARAGRVQSFALPRSVVEPVVQRLLAEQGSPPLDYMVTIDVAEPNQTTNVEIGSSVGSE
jgi:serine protease Do